MKRLHIIGRKNHGKTTLIADLIQELGRRQLRVGTVKHTHHEHELDTPGKDSHRHRMAGAAAVGIVSRGMNAVFWDEAKESSVGDQQYAPFERFMQHCDWLLVEGDTQAQAAKIEIWRAACQTEPIAREDATVRAIVTDDPIEIRIPVLGRSNVAAIADWIERL